jgi:hypothetical protein
MSSLHILPFSGASGDLSCRAVRSQRSVEVRRSTDRPADLKADLKADLQEDLRPARGVWAGVVIGAALWSLLIAAGWLIFR